MKKHFLFIVLALSISAGVLAQKSSVKLQVGYGAPISGSNFSRLNNGYTNVNGSLGSGLTIEAGYTYSIAPLISTQIDFGYLMSGETKGSYTDNITLINDSFSGNFFQAAPLIRFDVGDGKIHPYVAVGPMFAFGNMTEKYYENNDGGIVDQEIKYTASASIGAKSIIGLELTKGNLGFFVQATMINMNYAPTKSEVTKYNYNGQDGLANLNANQKFADFKDSIDPNAPYDPNQPRQELKTYYAFSSIALSIGARLKF